jgi:hypothetical protein
MPIGSCTRVVLLAAILVTLPTPAPAQVQRGTILGTVRDPSGAVLPGALVQLTSEVDAPREIASGDRGDYRFQDGTAGTATIASDTSVYKLAPGVMLPPGNARVLSNRDDYRRRYWNVDVVATRRMADGWMLRGFVTRQQHHEFFSGPRSIQDGTARIDGGPPVVSGLIDGGLAVSPFEFPIHATWSYSLAGVYRLPWQLSVSGTLYGRQGYPTAEFITVNRLGGLGSTQVLRDRDLDASRYPDVHLLDVRLQKAVSVGRLHATAGLDVFNALNTASILRQFPDGAAPTRFRQPLEIVAPRLVRLGLQLRF